MDNAKNTPVNVKIAGIEYKVLVSKNDLKRKEQIGHILTIRDHLAKKLKIDIRDHEGKIDLKQSNKLAEILYAFLHFVKKEKNSLESNTSKYAYDKQKTILVITHTFESLLKDAKDNCAKAITELDIQFSMPIINMMTAFKLQYDEVKKGTTKWGEDAKGRFGPKKDGDNEMGHDGQVAGPSGVSSPKRVKIDKTPQKGIRKEKLSDYHLDSSAIPFLRGITYTPGRRLELLSTMGPITLAILMFKAKAYKEKIAIALLNSISHLLNASELVKRMMRINDRMTYLGYLKSLVGVLRFIRDRSPHTAFFPLATFTTDYPYEIFDFTGEGMYYYYALRVVNETYIIETGAPNVDIPKQAIFHGIFGTHMEDLDLLGQVTNMQNWVTRSQSTDHFYFSGKEKRTVFVVGLPNWIRILKPKSANITKFGAGEHRQVNSIPVFGGYRKRHITREAFAVIEGICLENARGTTLWYKGVEILDDVGLIWGNCDYAFCPVEEGRYFYSD